MASQLDSASKMALRVSLAGICASVVLSTLNITDGVLVASTSVFATGVEFAGDVLASTVVFFGIMAASRPADEDHPGQRGATRTEKEAAREPAFHYSAGTSAGGLTWKRAELLGRTRRFAGRS